MVSLSTSVALFNKSKPFSTLNHKKDDDEKEKQEEANKKKKKKKKKRNEPANEAELNSFVVGAEAVDDVINPGHKIGIEFFL